MLDTIVPVEITDPVNVRILAVSGLTRNAALPDVPTLHEAGVKAFDHANAAYGAYVPTGTPPEVEIAHSDPTRVQWARDLQQRFPYDPGARNGVPAVIRSGSALPCFSSRSRAADFIYCIATYCSTA